MTIPSAIARNDHVGTGSLDTYSYSFKIFADSELEVTIEDLAGNLSTKTLTVDYTVTGVGDASGGTITLTAGNLTTGYKLTIRRLRPVTQTTDFRNQSRFLATVHEDEYDKEVMIDQQQQDEINRSLKLPVTEAGTAAATTIPGNRAGKWFGWDANGNPYAGLPMPGTDQVLYVIEVANIDDPSTELNTRQGQANGELLLCYQVSAGVNPSTLYQWDEAASGSESVPYSVDGSSGRFIAIGGKYINAEVYCPIFRASSDFVGTHPSNTSLYRSTSTGSTSIYGGTLNGGNIQAYGSSHATLPNQLRFLAVLHSWQSQNGSSTFGTIDATALTNAVGSKYTGTSTIVGAGGSPDATANGTKSRYFLDGSSNTCTLNLDAAPASGQEYIIKSIDSTNAVTIGRNGKNIEGAATDITLPTLASVTLHYDGTEWWIL